ncbi:helix-turn-helix domain-containing protein [Jeotgalicoccus saudimassiliensis]|nr:helix-turn-helix domain-containing protein [Jeotgalicoccus saudimassiliensis]
MKSNIKYSTNELLKYIELYLEGVSLRELRDNYQFDLDPSTFRQYVRKYLEHGVNGLLRQHNNRHYSDQFKYKVIQEYLRSDTSYKTLAVKYNIPSHHTVRQWVIRYTEGKENRTYSPKPEVYQMKSRKTTYEERIEIVETVINNQLSYKDAAEKFKVSYNNVYSWTQKYKKFGPKALEDNRGKKKPSEAQTSEEQLRTEIEALRVRNQWLEMENETLKKQEQMERELIRQEFAKKRRTKRSKR